MISKRIKTSLTRKMYYFIETPVKYLTNSKTENWVCGGREVRKFMVVAKVHSPSMTVCVLK